MHHVSPAEQSLEDLQARFGRNFREARIRAGLSQTEAADRTGTTQAYVSQIELGRKNLTLHSMTQLAAGLGSSVETLLTAETRTTTFGDLERVARILHRQIELMSRAHKETPVTIDLLCQVIRTVSSALGSHSIIIQTEPEKLRKK